MATMLSTRNLRAAPDGDATGVLAKAGARIKILDDTSPPWCKVKLLDEPGQPQGWVSIAAVTDDDAGSTGPLDKTLFALECMRQAALFFPSAHYLIASAELRTRIVDGPSQNGLCFGPYALTAGEWKTFNAVPDFPLGFKPDAISNWRNQCAVFAVAARATQQVLTSLIGEDPTVEELVLGQMIGPHAAALATKNGAATLTQILDQVAAADLLGAGVDRTTLTQRYSVLGGATMSTVVAALRQQIQAALDATKPLLAPLGAPVVTNPALPPAQGGSQATINLDAKEIGPGRADMAKLIMSQFAAAGFGNVQQIAAVANAIAESGLNPKAASPLPERSYGLFQLNLKGVGAGHTQEFLSDPVNNIGVMLAFIRNNKKFTAFKSTSSLLDAVTIFVANFEQPAGTTAAITKRFGIAQRILA